jgi:anti-repressor protein
MNELTVKTVPFMDAELMAAKDEEAGKINVGVSYICRGIGLNKGQKDTQVEKIQQDAVLSKGCRKFPAGVFDSNNETVALDLDFLPLWLAKITITPNMQTEQPEVADKLVQYQLKAQKVLADAFLHKTESYAPKASSLGEVANTIKTLRSIMKENKQSPEKIAEMAESVCKQFNVNIPDNLVKHDPYQMNFFANANFYIPSAQN